MKLTALLLIAVAALSAACAPRQIANVPSEYRWQENGWIACPGQPDPAKPPRPSFRTGEATSSPADLPASWRQTLYHQGETIEPVVVLNGKALQ